MSQQPIIKHVTTSNPETCNTSNPETTNSETKLTVKRAHIIWLLATQSQTYPINLSRMFCFQEM